MFVNVALARRDGSVDRAKRDGILDCNRWCPVYLTAEFASPFSVTTAFVTESSGMPVFLTAAFVHSFRNCQNIFFSLN